MTKHAFGILEYCTHLDRFHSGSTRAQMPRSTQHVATAKSAYSTQSTAGGVHWLQMQCRKLLLMPKAAVKTMVELSSTKNFGSMKMKETIFRSSFSPSSSSGIGKDMKHA